MKKIYLSLLTICLGLAAHAQTLTQANHAPVAGDTYSMTTCNGTISTAGNQGTNVIYNFTSVSLSSTVTGFSASTATNTIYSPANIDVANTNGEEAFYLSSATDLKYYGGNIIIAGAPATITYTSPAIYAKYPMGFGTATTSAIGGTMSALSNNGTFTGTASVLADGTGTIMLPGRTFTNVLRVVTSQTINFMVPAFNITNGVLNQVVYDFYVPLRKSPLFTITTSTASAPPLTSTPSSQTVITVADNYMTVGISENTKQDITLSVFPNPSNTTVNFVTESKEARSVSVYDITGKFIEKQALTEGKLKLNVLDYSSGLYIYSVIGSNNEVLKTGKITVNH